MNALTLDTLQYVKHLKNAGFTMLQAEAQIEVLEKIIHNRLATKGDIETLKKDIEKDIEKLRQEGKIERMLIRKEGEAERMLIRKDMKIQALLTIGSLSGVIAIATTILLHFIK